MKNNFAFIDSQNLNLAVQNQGWKIDWNKFRIYLTHTHSVQKAYLFIGYVPTNQFLYTSLQDKGFIVIFKPTLRLPDGTPKGNVDAELILHATLGIPHYDKAVIVAGDGDYFCLIEHLKKINKLKSLIIPNKSKYSSLLRKFASDMAYITDLKHKLEYK